MKKIRILIITVIILSLAAGSALRAHRAATVDEAAALRELAPRASFSPKNGNPPFYRGSDGSVAFNSFDVVPSIRGYAGPIKLMLVLDRTGAIRGIKILEHRETKTYVHYLETPGYLSRFIGKTIADHFEVDRDVDGITRATVSVEALARTAKESSRLVAAEALGLRAGDGGGQAGPRRFPRWSIAVVLFLLSFAGYFVTRRTKKFRRLRDLSLIAGLAGLGFFLSAPFSVLHVFNLLLLRPSSSALWYAVVFGTLLTMTIAGRFYCGWLCPFGALSELIGRLPVKKWEAPAEADNRWRKLKYAFFGFAAALVLVSGRVDNGNYETFVTLFSLHGNVFTWSLVALSLIACLRVERFWCRYLCPVAALGGLLSRKAGGYNGAADCPMGNRRPPEISECIRCNRCYNRVDSGGWTSGAS